MKIQESGLWYPVKCRRFKTKRINLLLWGMQSYNDLENKKKVNRALKLDWNAKLTKFADD